MYKLRYTWTAANLFKPATLQELDRRIHEIDPAWPILKSYAPPQTQHGGGSHKILINPTQPNQHGGSHKILINPAKFPQVNIIHHRDIITLNGGKPQPDFMM